MTRYIYEVDNKNIVRIWDTENPNENNEPFFLQPDWPNGTPWASKAEASAWAELLIESIANPESEFVPGDSPDQPQKPRPVDSEIVE